VLSAPGRQNSRRFQLRVIGLGAVGASVAENALRRGHRVTGVDNDENRLDAIRLGTDRRLATLSMHAGKNLRLTRQPMTNIAHDATFVCVPTWSDNGFDNSKLGAALDALGPVLAPGELVAIESTVPPHTTRTFARERLEACGRRAGHDFFLVASPERFDMSSARDIGAIPKLVGGVTPGCTLRGIAIYSELVDEVVPLSDSATAEAAKLLENVYRFVNVALINEVSELHAALGLDSRAVIAAAATKPFGFMPFWPSTGIGGECLPLAAKTCSSLAHQAGVLGTVVDAALASDADAAYRVLRIVQSIAASSEVKRVLFVGATYKSDVPSTAASTVPTAIQLLRDRGYCVDLIDPHIAADSSDTPTARATGRIVTASTRAPKYDLVVVAAWHDELRELIESMDASFIVDLSGSPAPLSKGGPRNAVSAAAR
jgi:UDP-N-acetyl-D-glucosamine dehydrogenase